MSTDQIKNLMSQLQEELRRTELDDETRARVREFDAAVHGMLEDDPGSTGSSSIIKRAKELEANFATDHPAAERFMREVIDVLVRIGI